MMLAWGSNESDGCSGNSPVEVETEVVVLPPSPTRELACDFHYQGIRDLLTVLAATIGCWHSDVIDHIVAAAAASGVDFESDRDGLDAADARGRPWWRLDWHCHCCY